MDNALSQISKAGVAVWLDDLSRERLKNHSLEKLIKEDNVVGVTTNPSIFSSAIGKSDLYKNDIVKHNDKTIEEIITILTTDDVSGSSRRMWRRRNTSARSWVPSKSGRSKAAPWRPICQANRSTLICRPTWKNGRHPAPSSSISKALQHSRPSTRSSRLTGSMAFSSDPMIYRAA